MKLARFILIFFTTTLSIVLLFIYLHDFPANAFNKFIHINNVPNRETEKISNFISQENSNISPEIQKIVNEYNLKNPPRKDVRLLVISDLNSAYGSTEYEDEVHLALKMIPFWQPDLILSGGDMIAGQKPSLTIPEIKAMWQGFETQIAQPIRKLNIPFGFTIGNHDASSAMTGDRTKFLFDQERKLAVEYWQNPKHDPQVKFIDRTLFPFYYTFEEKGIFFLVWDGSSSHIPPERLAWVEKSLASPQAQQAKMRMIIGHLPLYAVAEGRNFPGEVLNNAEKLRALMEKYNVHTYVSGHHHAYYPAHRGKLQLLHTGALGSGARPFFDSTIFPRKTITVLDVDFSQPDLTTYTTYDMTSLKVIEYEELPRLLLGHNGMIIRRDLEVQDLTANEKQACISQFNLIHCQE